MQPEHPLSINQRNPHAEREDYFVRRRIVVLTLRVRIAGRFITPNAPMTT